MTRNETFCFPPSPLSTLVIKASKGDKDKCAWMLLPHFLKNMKVFRYKLLTPNGQVRTDSAALPFEDLSPAMRYLERQGGVVLDIAFMGSLAAALSRVFGRRERVGRNDLAEVFNNLAMLLAAGVPVLAALSDVAEDLRRHTLTRVLRFMRTDIENGQTLSEAMARHPDVFSPLILNMCRIGEETGALDVMLKKCSQHLLHLEQIIAATRRALLYPAFLALVVAAAAAFWLLVVTPQLVQLFKDMDIALPFLTRLLIQASEAVQSYGFAALATVAGLALGLRLLWRRSEPTRYLLDAAMLRLPILGAVVETALVARISEYLGILLAAGVGVLRTLEIVSAAVGNRVYRKRLLAVQENIRNGFPLSESMRQAKAIHPFAIRMIAIGELAGNIDDQTEYVAKTYRERLSALVEVLGKTLEPVMLVILGGIFALVILGLLIPVYDLAGKMGG